MGEIDIDLSFDDVDRFVEKHKGKNDSSSSTQDQSEDFSFEVISVLGELSDKSSSPVLAIIKWGGYLRYDLRKWNKNMSRPYKGMAFDTDEIDIILSLPEIDINLLHTPIATFSNGKAKADIYARIALLNSTEKGEGWNKEINIVDWGFGKKIDFRKWKKDYSKCGKGICISLEEFSKMISLLKKENSKF